MPTKEGALSSTTVIQEDGQSIDNPTEEVLTTATEYHSTTLNIETQFVYRDTKQGQIKGVLLDIGHEVIRD